MSAPILSPFTPRFAAPRVHLRTPSRSPTRTRITDDLLSDLSPATTLEAFTNPSGKLRASIEAATPVERAFGMRAALASKKIEEWLVELSAWPWPSESTSAGFDMPAAKRRIPASGILRGARSEEAEYMGSLRTEDVIGYETRIEEINEDMEDLDVDGIKRRVLDTHVSPRSRPSSSASNAPVPSLFASYTKMDDFTAVITATVLQSLPKLSKLMRLMDVWSVRLAVLQRIPPLLLALSDAEIALSSGWTTVNVSEHRHTRLGGHASHAIQLSRRSFEVMKAVLQDKVTKLGQEIDHILDTLEGRQDTLPEQWLDRMEIIEQNYGDWVVASEQKVREVEWATVAKAKKEAEDVVKREQEIAEVARREAELRMERIQTAEVVRQASDNLTGAEDTNLLAYQQTGKGRKGSPNVEPEAEISLDNGALFEPIDSIIQYEKPLPYSAHAAVKDTGVAFPQSPEPLPRTSYPTHPDNIISLPTATEASNASGLETNPVSGSRYQNDSSSTGTHDAEISPLKRTKLAQLDGNLSEAEVSNFATAGPLKYDNLDNNAANREAQPELPCISILDEKRIKPAYEKMIFERAEPSDVPPSTSYEQFSAPQTFSRLPDVYADESSAARTLQFASQDLVKVLQPLYPSLDVSFSRNTSTIDPICVTPSITAGLDTATSDLVAPLPFEYLSQGQVKDTAIVDEPDFTQPRTPKLPNFNIKFDPDCLQIEHADSSGSSPSNSHVSGYSISDPTPLILEAESASYFALSPSPERSSTSLIDILESPKTQTPTKSSFVPRASTASGNLSVSTLSETSVGRPICQLVPDAVGMALQKSTAISRSRQSFVDSRSSKAFLENSVPGCDGSNESIPVELELQHFSAHQYIASDELPGPSVYEEMPESRNFVRDSTAVTESDRGAFRTSPCLVSSPDSEIDTPDSFSQTDELSPTAGRVGHRSNQSCEISPPDSPTTTAIPRYRSLEPLANFDFSRTGSIDAVPTPILDAPMLQNVVVSEAPMISSPNKSGADQNTDDQIQKQISHILESIPARIVLTSEFGRESSKNVVVPPKKLRRPIMPSYRSHSSLSVYSRAPTPSFTLAPAYGKGTSRPRPQSSNPEIKLYHLSRSTGEAPIKLLVRLVGERGERVMVRVGGGWADLGEYLREYASHHGRRSVSGEHDKVEVQSISSRDVSNSSTATLATVRGRYGYSGRSSPISRPASAFDRPMSSLAVRKTRQSLTSETGSLPVSRPHNLRSPSTPLPIRANRKPLPTPTIETPPSASSELASSSSRSGTRLSWTEEDSSLGLAGPKSKKVMSERDQEWVDTMTEKVRLASAEKEKEKVRVAEREKRLDGIGRVQRAGGKEGHASFGELEKVRGTKRLFRRG